MEFFTEDEIEIISKVDKESIKVIKQKIEYLKKDLYSICLINELNHKVLISTIKSALLFYIIYYLLFNFNIRFISIFLIISFVIRIIAGTIIWFMIKKEIKKVNKYFIKFKTQDNCLQYKQEDIDECIENIKKISYIMETKERCL